MGRGVFGATGAAAVVLLAVCAAVLHLDSLPRLGEVGALAEAPLQHARQLAEHLYVGALLLVPGAAQATVVGRTTEAEPLDEPQAAAQMPTRQRTARGEHEVDEQKELSAKRYRELRQELAQGGEEPLLIPEPLDEVRQRMPPVDPKGPVMRCGEAIGPRSTVVTNGVELSARSIYQGSHGSQFAWKYEITMANRGEATVQMLTRHWIFVDGMGRLESEVKGPGARGVTPVLSPGGEWSYESGTSLPTSYGSMHGSFQFEVLKGNVPSGEHFFSARVGRLLLATSRDAAKEVPCLSPASSNLIPLTSVLASERVIVGGRTEAQGKSKDQKYIFAYDVQINNARDAAIEVVGHSWEVVDEAGSRHLVAEGSGVGGVYKGRARELRAGDAFRVQGVLTSSTPRANAQGTYRVIIRADDGSFREIEARTDYMGLAAEADETHVPNFVVDPRFR